MKMTFQSDTNPPVELREGTVGHVLRIDDAGSAEIDFEGIEKQLVSSESFDKLDVEGEATTGKTGSARRAS